ncbi:hypothetical protein ACS5PK_10400 [Roseateles sp. DB2]|uniref:hypothetical protein n=1 Tax=Roseateles sp. DB2 TaxID=3453717 RepID=UPI003EEE23F9
MSPDIRPLATDPAGPPLVIALDSQQLTLKEGDAPPRRLRNRLLPRLLAALLLAHAEGQACEARPCSRKALQQRLGDRAELHRTQLWRALQALDDSPLCGLIRHGARSAGPFWLDEELLARCRWQRHGLALVQADWLALLAPSPTDARIASPALPRQALPLAYVQALSRADLALERGELYPARLALAQATDHIPVGDLAAQLSLSLRRARIARRLGDWATLQQELRTLRQGLEQPGLPLGQARQIGWRLAVLEAWHCHGSLGESAVALQKLAGLDEQDLALDAGLLVDYLNLRGMAGRELALQAASAEQACAALEDLAAALRQASLAGLPDALQVSAANLSNALCLLQGAGLLPPRRGAEAWGWLLLSESVCERWGLARHSLLNTIFLLRIAEQQGWTFAQAQQRAEAEGLPLAGDSFRSLAAERWETCRRLHSQLPAEQRCAFLLLWARHAWREGDALCAAELVQQARHHGRKLRAESQRERYEGEARQLMAALGLSAQQA